MRRPIGVVGALLAALLAAAALAGCRGGDDPGPSPTDPVSSATPTPDDPSASSTPQAETPEEFIRRWIAVSNSMQISGDTEEYRRLSNGCVPCDGVAARIEAVYGSGGRVDTEGWTVVSVQRTGGRKGRPVFEVAIDNDKTTVVEEANAPPEVLPGGEALMEFVLHARKGTYVVADLSQLAT